MLVQCFMKANDWTWDEAIEWVEFNVLRSLPYYGYRAPVVLNLNYIKSNNKNYIPLKIV